MASSKLSLIFCFVSILSIGAVVEGATHHHHAAPAPSVDCSTLILSMADCLTFVSNDSTATKPEATCCSGLKTVLQTDAQCLCEAFKNSAQLGVVLNVAKALSLPTACKIHAPSVSNCGLSLAPASSPGSSAAAPTVASGAIEQAPAPSPGVSGSHGLSVSVGSLVVSLVVALFSSF